MTLLLQTSNRKSCMARRTAAIPMTLSDLQGHLPTACRFKCVFVELCSSWQDANWQRAWRGLSVIAELLVRLSAINMHCSLDRIHQTSCSCCYPTTTIASDQISQLTENGRHVRRMEKENFLPIMLLRNHETRRAASRLTSDVAEAMILTGAACSSNLYSPNITR